MKYAKKETATAVGAEYLAVYDAYDKYFCYDLDYDCNPVFHGRDRIEGFCASDYHRCSLRFGYFHFVASPWWAAWKDANHKEQISKKRQQEHNATEHNARGHKSKEEGRRLPSFLFAFLKMSAASCGAIIFAAYLNNRKNRGKDMSTTEGSVIVLVPPPQAPKTAMLIAIRWSPYV